MTDSKILSPLYETSAPSSVLIQIEQITKVYGSGNSQVHALAGVDFVVKKGEYCAIMGPSGSGKSTMMNIVGCLDRPSSGKYYLDGVDVAHASDSDLAAIRNQKIGFVFQQFHLLTQLTALDNVVLPMIYAGIKPQERRDRAVAALERVGLSDRLYNKPNQLSGGQQQRVAIARAIVNKPLLLLADEPTGALDSHTAEEVMNLFQGLNESGITVVMVTHEPDIATRSERIAWFKDGSILHSHLTREEMMEVVLAGNV